MAILFDVKKCQKMPKMESAMKHVFEIECKDKGFLNESVSDFHQSCIKPLIFYVFATCG